MVSEELSFVVEDVSEVIENLEAVKWLVQNKTKDEIKDAEWEAVSVNLEKAVSNLNVTMKGLDILKRCTE